MLSNIVNFIVEFVAGWGYLGIFVMMFLESSFFPFPSEVVMIPAGYLASKSQMSFVAAFVCGLGGSITGALFNYYLCYFFGRKIIAKYGKYVGITEEKFTNELGIFHRRKRGTNQARSASNYDRSIRRRHYNLASICLFYKTQKIVSRQ